jgi:hypothetical protein
MLGKRWLPKDVMGKVPQDLCAMVKARLLEAYSPAVQGYAHRKASDTDAGVCVDRIIRFTHLSDSRRWRMKPFKGRNGPPTAHSDGRW